MIASADSLHPYAERHRFLRLSGSTPAERSALESIGLRAALDGESSGLLTPMDRSVELREAAVHTASRSP